MYGIFLASFLLAFLDPFFPLPIKEYKRLWKEIPWFPREQGSVRDFIGKVFFPAVFDVFLSAVGLHKI